LFKHDANRGWCIIGYLAGEHLEGYYAQGVDVALFGKFLTLTLFRGHIGWCSDQLTGGGELWVIEQFGDAKIGQEGFVVIIDHDIRGFDITV